MVLKFRIKKKKLCSALGQRGEFGKLADRGEPTNRKNQKKTCSRDCRWRGGGSVHSASPCGGCSPLLYRTTVYHFILLHLTPAGSPRNLSTPGDHFPFSSTEYRTVLLTNHGPQKKTPWRRRHTCFEMCVATCHVASHRLGLI